MPLLLLTADRPAGAARERRRAGDRPAQAVRRRREVVLRGRRRTTPAQSGCAGCARSPAAPTGPRSRAARAPCTSTSRCASRSSPTRRCPTTTRARADGRPYVSRPVARLAARPDDSELHRAARGARARRDRRRARRAHRRSARPRPSSRRPPAGRCSPTRCPARAAGPRRSPTTTPCCATRVLRRGPRPDLVLRVGDLPVSKPLRTWLAGLADAACARWRSTPRGPGRTRRRCSRTASRSTPCQALDTGHGGCLPARAGGGLAGELAQRR